MDEEQPKKKITLNNFFEQIVEIDKVANMALSNSNMVQSQLNAVQMDLKRLIESLQINFDSGVQNVQNQINEVTNVIVQEQEIKKSETDALEEQIFVQEDQLQKQVKGKKATSSDDNLIQKAMSSVKNKAKSNLLAAGLFGGSFLLAGLKPPKSESDYEKNRRNNRRNRKNDNDNESDLYTEDESQSLGFLSGFTEENVGDNAFGFGTDLGIDDAFGFGSFNTDSFLGGDGNLFNFPLTETIIETSNDTYKAVEGSGKEQLLTILEAKELEIEEKIDDLDEDKVFRGIEYDETEYKNLENQLQTIQEATENLKFNKTENYDGGNDYLKKFLEENKDIKFNPQEGIIKGESTSNRIITGGFPDENDSKEGKINVGDYGFGFDGFNTDIYKFTDDNTSNNVIDGGTTIIEGNNEVVNEDIGGGQGRGEVATDVSIVKSSNSPVTAVAIAEGNSLNHLTI